MLLHAACYNYLLSQIHNIKLVFALGFTKTESCKHSITSLYDVFKDKQPLLNVILVHFEDVGQ